MPAEAAAPAPGHEPGGNWMDLLIGFTRPAPADAPGPLKTAFLLWRITVFLVPVSALLIGLFIADTGAQMRADAEAMMDDVLLIIFSFGLFLIIATILWILGAILSVVAVLFVVLAVPLGLLFNLALGRTLRGANRSAAAGLWTLTGAWVTAFFTVAPLIGILSSWTGSDTLSLILALPVLLVPVVAFILLARRKSRAYIRERHVKAHPGNWIRVPEPVAPPAPRQYQR